MADKKISQLDSVPSISSGSEFPFSKSGSTYKGTVDQIGDYVGKTQTFNTLQTTDKTLVGAINEAAQSGSVEMEETVTTPVAVAVFADGGDDIPVKSLKVKILSTQSSGTPSPSNPKPITSYNSVNVKVDDISDVTKHNYTVPLGQYVGRGLLDVTKGILTITHGYKDLGSLSYVLSGSGQLRANVDNLKVSSAGQDETDALCSHYELKYDMTVAGFNALDNVIEIGSTNLTNYSIAIRDSSITSASDAPTALAGRYIVYELETPVVIDLSPTQVNTILGTNKIYANSGDIDTLIYFNNNARETADVVDAMKQEIVVEQNRYSTNEHIVGSWIDGRNVYERTISVVRSGGATFTVDLSSWGIGTLIDISGTIIHSNNKQTSVTYYGDYQDFAVTVFDIQTGELTLVSTGTSRTGTWLLTFRYVK